MIILLLILLTNSAVFLSNYKFNMNFINYDNNSILANITYYHQGPEYRSEKGGEKLSDYSSFNKIVCPQNVEIILKDVDKNRVLCRIVMNDCNVQCVFPVDKTSTRLNIEYTIKKGTNFENEIVGNVQLTYFKDAKGELIIFENVNPVLGISIADAIKKKLQSTSLDSIALGVLLIALIGTSLYARGVGLASGIIDLLYPRLPRPRLSLNHAPGTINYGPGASNIKEAGNVVQTIIESLEQYRAKIDLNRDKGNIRKILNENEIKHLKSMLETIFRYNNEYRNLDSLKVDDYIKLIDEAINHLNRIKNVVDKADLYRKLATPQPFDYSVNQGQSVLTQAIENNKYGPLAKSIAVLTKAIFIPAIFYPARTLRGLSTVFYEAFAPLVAFKLVAFNKDFRKRVNTDPAGLMQEAEKKLKEMGSSERMELDRFTEKFSIKKEDKILDKIINSLINIVAVPVFALGFPIWGSLRYGFTNIYREVEANAIMFAVGQVGKEIMHVSQKELKDSIKTIDENMKMTAASLVFLKILTEKSNLLKHSKSIAYRLKYANNESLQDLIKEFSMEFNNNPFILRTIQLMYRILNNDNLSDVEKIQELKKLLSIFDVKTGIEYLDELEEFYRYISTVPDDSVQKPIAYLTFLEHVRTKIGIDPNSPWFEIRGHNEVNPLLNKFAEQFEHEQLGLAFLPFIIAMRSKNETELHERREKLPYYSFAILLSKHTTWTAPVYVARMVKGKFEGVFELQPEIRNEILQSFVREFTERLIAENNMDNKQIYQIREQMNDLIKNIGSIQTIDDFKQQFYEYTSAIRQITGDQNIKFDGIELNEAENKDLIRRIWDFHSDRGEKLLKNLGVDQDPALIHYFRTNLIQDNKGQNNDEINNAIISGLKDYIDLTKSLELCLSEIRDRDTYIEYMINHEKDYKIEFEHNISADSLKQPIRFIFADRQDLFVSTTKLADAKGFDENASIVKRREVPILSLVDFLDMNASERSVQSQIYLRQNKGAYPLTENEERALSRESIFNEELEKAILSVDPRTQKAKYNEEYLAHYIGAFLVATNWVNKVIQYEYSLNPKISIYDLSAKQVEQIISGDEPIQLDIKNEDSKSNDNKEYVRIQINPLRGMSVNVPGLYDHVNVVIRDDEIIFRPFLERVPGLIKKDMFGRISRELTEKYFEKSIERIPLSSVDRPISLVAMRYNPIKGYYDVTYQNSNIEKELSILLSRLGDNLVPLLKRYTDRSEEDIAYALYKSLSYNVNPLLNYSLSRLKIKISKFYRDLENPEILSQMLDKLNNDTSFEATIVKIYIAQRLIIQQNADPRIKSIIDRLQKIDHIKILEMINKNTNDVRILGILGIIGEMNIQDIDVRKAVDRGLLVGNSPSNVASKYMSLKRELKPSDGEVGFGIFDRFKDFAVTAWNTNIYFNTIYHAMLASPYLDFAEKFGHTTGMLQHYYPLISQLFSLQARNNAKIAFRAETYVEQIRESINASPNQLTKILQDSDASEIDQITNQIISYVLEEHNLITEIATILNVDREIVAIHLNSIIRSDPNLRPSQISNLLINKLGLNVSSSSIQNQVKKIIDINSKINQLTASINDKILESLDDAEKLILRYANNSLKIDLNSLIQKLQNASVDLNDQETVIKLLSSYLPKDVDPKNVYLMIVDIKALRGQLDSEITSLGERLVNRQYLDPLDNKLLRDIGGKLIYLNLLREDLNHINQNIADISTASIISTRHKLYNLIQNLEKLNSSKTGEMYLSLKNVKDRQNIERQLAIANAEITRSIVNIVELEEKYIRGYFMNSWLMNVRSTKGVWGDFGSFRGSDIAPTYHAGSGLFYPYYPYTMLFAITPQSVNPDDKTRNKSYFEIIKKRSNPIIHPLYSLTIKDVYRPIDSSKLEYEIESGKLDSEFEAWINRKRYLSMPSFIRYLDVFYNSAIKPISISNFRDLNLQRASIEGYLLLHPVSMLYRGFYKSFKTTSVLDTPLPIFDRYKYNVHSIYVSKGMPSPRYANIFPNPALAWLHLKEYLLPTPPNLMNVYYGSNVLNTIFYPVINLPLGSLFAFALSRNPERLARYQNLVNYKANLLFRRKIEGMNISDFEERLLTYRPSYFYHEWLSSSVGAYWDLPGYGHIDQASGRLTIIEMYRRLYYHDHTRFERYNLNHNIWTRRRELLSDLEYYRPESAYQLDISQTFNLWILLFPGINFIPGISTIINRYPLSFSAINKVSHMSSYGYVIPTYNIAYIRTQYGNGTVPRRLLRASGSRGLPPKDPRAGYLDTLRRLEINLKNKSRN